MRFLADGPSIPDDLLIARDEGRVIFFCGAGVSRARAGLSDFLELASKVIETLGVTTDIPAKKLVEEAGHIEHRTGISGLISADRVFGVLEREFFVRDIDSAVARALKPSSQADLSAHRIMLDLAKGPDRRVRLVTTNFDLLFESCDESLKCWNPHALPDPSRYEEFEGIIHLHGHVDKDYDGSVGDGFVLSSSQFGRAYLSDGWATRFIRSILEKYFVVFVGYTADDPPVQYLLEALNWRSDSRHGVYAFQSGTIIDAQAKWHHKGVQPIAYDEAVDHKALWDTLAAWSTRAQNPEAWYESVIALARKGPESLLAHERGQIAHIVSTIEGARKFSGPDEPCPADWLCVFDPSIRYSTPGYQVRFKEKGPYFDPFNAYSLDSDSVPAKVDPDDYLTKREVPSDVWNCFAATRLDRKNLRDDNFAALVGRWSADVPSLSNRLWQLGVWIGKVANQPATVWWAARQIGIHPSVQAQIQFEVEQKNELSLPEIRKAWRCIFMAWEKQKSDPDNDWLELKASINLDGWTTAAVRKLPLIYRPFVSVKKPFWGGPKPPENSKDIQLEDMLRLHLECPCIPRDLVIPDEHIPTAVRELRRNLEEAVFLGTELGGYCLDTLVPIEPDHNLDGEASARALGISGQVLFYVSLFKRLLGIDLKAAKQEFSALLANDDFIFARLRIWACGVESILSGVEAGQLICDLNDRVFWDGYHQRDLLLVLQKCWGDFPSEVKSQIEDRLLKGPSQWEREIDADYSKRRAWLTLDRIHWLGSHGCDFSFDIAAEVAKIRKFVPNWDHEYGENAAASGEPRGGSVRIDEECTELIAEPLGSLLSKAVELDRRAHGSFVQNESFAGLVSKRPVRAFSALISSAKRNDYPEWAWRTFLNSQARKSDKPRFAALIAERVSRLPTIVLMQLTYPASEWLLTSSEVLLRQFPKQFEQVWTNLISALKNSESARFSTVRVSRQPDWGTEALNSQAGKLMQALMNDPQRNVLEPGKGFPLMWINKVNELLSLGGDPRRHALVMIAFNLNWFFVINSAWTDEKLLSVLDNDGDDQNALWAGFFWGSAKVPNQEFYMRLKPHLLRLARKKPSTRSNHVEALAAVLMVGWGIVDRTNGERWVTNAEMRDILVKADDDFKAWILWNLGSWSSKEEQGSWREKLPVFLAEVWPRHKKANTPKTSAKLINLALTDSGIFHDIIDIILPLVVRTDQEHLVLPRLARSDDIVDNYPEKILALLSAVLPENVSDWPYSTDSVLGRIGDAKPSLLIDSRLVELKRQWNAR